MNSVTLVVGVILYGSTPGATNMNTNTKTYHDVKSCAEALEHELEAIDRPDVYSVSGTCTIVRPKR